MGILGTIIKRELVDHLQSVQFAVLTGASLVLFAGNGIVFVRSFPQENAAYVRNRADSEQEASTVSTNLYKAPNPLRFIADGGDRYRPSGYSLKPAGSLDPLPTRQVNFKMPDVPELDWSFLIRIVFSLYVILLGFQSIAGEKETGTLRLVLAHSVSRMQLLTAKFVSVLLMALAPLLMGGLISLAIIGAWQPQVLTAASLARIAAVLPLAAFFLGFFALLSICISALVPRSSLVLLILLAVWVVLAVIVPNTSAILAETASKAPSEYQMARMVGPLINQQVFDRVKAVLSRAEKGEFATEEAMKAAGDKAFEQGQKDLVRHYQTYDSAMKQRATLARILSRLSPTGLFQYALEAIAGAGSSMEEEFVRQVRTYSHQYDDYIVKKMGKLVPTSNFSFSVSTEMKGKMVMLSSPYPEEYKGDKSDYPRFREIRPSFLQSVQDSMPDMAGLLAWSMLLAALAFAAFLRTDVR